MLIREIEEKKIENNSAEAAGQAGIVLSNSSGVSICTFVLVKQVNWVQNASATCFDVLSPSLPPSLLLLKSKEGREHFERE